MIEELRKDIYRIGVVLPENPLKELNSYFIRGKESDLLIDTGFRRQECRDALQAGLDEIGSDPARRDVLVTHVHSDHSGMADLFVGPERKIYMSDIDIKVLENNLSGEMPKIQNEAFLSFGFTQEMLDYIDNNSPARVLKMPAMPDCMSPLFDGDVLTVGDYTLKVVLTPGHTPGNIMLWDEEHGIMFTGDHILFTITPNINFWPGVNDSLGNYLASLERVKNYPVKIAYPAHRQLGDYHERIDSLIAHHEARLNETYKIVIENPGLPPYDIAGLMTWRIRAKNWDEFPIVQKWFAVGECISHLDYLLNRGKVRFETRDGIRYYYEQK